ncbi:hypothetical protein SELMODRAFT_402885 [Selaginella moellendorffii]|uniref:PGG domain-containing protein n=1 Tax=Selaginella moellendorffii TaxID=88036 RepID=D8QNC6_SELML|nr:hypothetical protein SELMODRAFT_402885 [Selaginella moellendorffii]
MLNYLQWSSYIKSLQKDRQMFVDGLNAILVGSALIASVAFGGFLNPPLGYKLKFKDRESHRVLRSPDKFNLRLLRRLRQILIAAAVMLVLSIIFVLVGFGAAGFSELPPSGNLQPEFPEAHSPAKQVRGAKNTISQLVAALKRCFKVQDHSEVGGISFGRETLQELLSRPSQSTLEVSPQRPKRYARGQRPWEDGLDSLVPLTQTYGQTVITVTPDP